jgi:transcriptional regulator with XRE-family HTH domain
MAIKGIKQKFPFGQFLKSLREQKGVSLVDVEKATGISNAYLSQLETGARRRLPPPDRLRMIADYYNVTGQELLKAAGYLDEKDVEETYEQKVDKLFTHIINNPDLKSGVRIDPKGISLDVKRFIVEIHTQHLKKSVLLAKPYIVAVIQDGNKVKKLNWKTDDLKREEYTADGKKCVRYRVTVTCIETEGRTSSPSSDEFIKGTEKVTQTVTADGEFSQQASTINGYETSLLFKATQDALRKAVPKIKGNAGWSVNHLSPWMS